MPRTSRSLKDLQNSVGDLENLAARPSTTLKDSMSTQETVKENTVNVQVERNNSCDKEIQVNIVENGFDVGDLTNPEGASENYWRILANQRLNALKEALKQKEILENIKKNLDEELAKLQQMLNEANEFVGLVQDELLSDDTGIDVDDLSAADESLDISNDQDNII